MQTIEACARLGLPYPVADWSSGWQQIQVAVADASKSIRDELQASR